MGAQKAKELTATGDVTTTSAYLHVVTIAGNGGASTVVVRSGGGSGTRILELDAANGGEAVVDLKGVLCPDGIHATITGAGSPAATFTYE